MATSLNRHFKIELFSLESRLAPTAADINLIPDPPATRVLAIGSDQGQPARSWEFNTQTKTPVYYANSATDNGEHRYEETFTGGVRPIVADLNGDQRLERIVTSGPGRPTEVYVKPGQFYSNPQYQTPPYYFLAFEQTFSGGGFLSAADFSGDGADDLVVTPDQGGGPRVRIFSSGLSDKVLVDFYGIEDPNFRGGARTATGDVNADGTPDLIVAAGYGGGPRVAVFDGRSLRGGQTPRKLFGDFFVFEPTLRNGVYLTSADLNGDGSADIVAGGGPGGGPRVFALSGRDLVVSNTPTQLANFFAGDPTSRSGVRLTIKDVDGDNRLDLVTGPGEKARVVTAYSGKGIPINGMPTVLKEFRVEAAFTGQALDFGNGVFVG